MLRTQKLYKGWQVCETCWLICGRQFVVNANGGQTARIVYKNVRLVFIDDINN